MHRTNFLYPFVILATLVVLTGCDDTTTEVIICADGTVVNDSADCVKPPPDPADVQATVVITLNKGANFFFTGTATSNMEASLESGTWTVKDVTNQPVHNETGVQMSLSLDRHPNKCEFFTVEFVPIMKEGFSAKEAVRKRIEWPNEEDCKPERLIADFSCRDIGSFVANCLNKSTGEEPLSCRFSWGDPDGSTTQECGFNGVNFDYGAAGLFTVRLRMVDARGNVKEIDKLLRIE